MSAMQRTPARTATNAPAPSEGVLRRSRAGPSPDLGAALPGSTGRPLEPDLRGRMEQRFGEDFSTVRVHDDARAAASAAGMAASAYAQGDDIVFGRDRHQPDTIAGRMLMAHELTHVVQQRRGGGFGGGAAGGLETEAHAASVDAISGRDVRVGQAAASTSPLLSPFSDQLGPAMAGGVKKVFDILRANCPLPAADTDTETWMAANLKGDDLWLAQKIYAKGPEPVWDSMDYDERFKRSSNNKWAAEPGHIEGSIGQSSGLMSSKQPIKAFFFPGETDQRALVIGGVHGSELAGVEVANRLADSLRARFDTTGKMPRWTVIIVPALFPESVAKARANPSVNKPKQRASNTGREVMVRRASGKGTKELKPARQYPRPGESLSDIQSKGLAADTAGTPLKDDEKLKVPVMDETVALLKLIERFKPSRVASVHSLRWTSGDKPKGKQDAPGAFADPRKDTAGKVLAKEGAEDDALALKIATDARAGGAQVPGNRLDDASPNARYVNPSKPDGFSLGDWGPSPVGGTGPGARAGMTTITVEVENYYDSSGDPGGARSKELQAHSNALQKDFLETP